MTYLEFSTLEFDFQPRSTRHTNLSFSRLPVFRTETLFQPSVLFTVALAQLLASHFTMLPLTMERTTTRRLKLHLRWIQRPPPPTFTLIYNLFTQIYTKYMNLFYSYSENSNRCTRRESRTAFSRWLPHGEIRDVRTKSP